MRTSAGLGSVPGMRPGTSVSNSANTGLIRSVHKCSDGVVPTYGLAHSATGGVGGACVRDPDWQAAQRTGSQGPAQPVRHHVPAAVHLGHLKKSVMDARVHAPGDESLESSRQGMRTIVRNDAAGVPERWRVQILHGSLGPREHVVPEELPLGQRTTKLTQQELRCVRREGGDKARKGCVCARVVLGHDRLAWGATGKAEGVDHGGDQGAAHDAAGNEGRKRGPERAVRRPSLPQVTPVVACHQE